MRSFWLVLLLLLSGAWLTWWVGHNPLPDGFQNEYLLIGNAWDLWGALVDLDQWHLRWYAYTGYWPFGLYVVPWPWMALLGPTRLALLLGNLLHLAVLLWSTDQLGRRLDAPLAPLLLLLAPGVFGALVRYEPNLAVLAWTAAGLAFLLRSEGLSRRREAVFFGLAFGVGLMMDRLSVAFFLLPALLPTALAGLRRAPRRALGTLALALLACLSLSLAWYREFFLRHADELLSQAPVGEIDAAGEVSATDGPMGLLYYPLALVDSQAGPLLGIAMILGLGLALTRRRPRLEAWRLDGWRLDDPRLPLLASALVSLAFFTLLPKKQVFYTLPALVPLAVLAARWRPLAVLGLAGGAWSFAALGLGLVPGGPWLPEAWVSPRHVLARPPSFQQWPLQQAFAALEAGGTPSQVAVFSQDQTFFEGFAVLALRERFPESTVRGVVLDPVGTYEQIESFDALLWIGPPSADWPTQAQVETELLADHYTLDELPPVADVLVGVAPHFFPTGTAQADNGDGPVRFFAFRRAD